MKKEWCRPALKVIAKRESQESVLFACKRSPDDLFSSGPRTGGCITDWSSATPCNTPSPS